MGGQRELFQIGEECIFQYLHQYHCLCLRHDYLLGPNQLTGILLPNFWGITDAAKLIEHDFAIQNIKTSKYSNTTFKGAQKSLRNR